MLRKTAFIVFLTTVFLLINYPVTAQIGSEEETALMQSAFFEFENHNYEQAAKYFEQLLEFYPKDPDYHYYLGRSLVLSGRQIEKAIEHLQFASRKDVPKDVYYYLGRAYHFSYQFDEAVQYYIRFEEIGKRDELERLEVAREIGRCNNGKFLSRYIREPKILGKKWEHDTLIHTHYIFNDYPGKIIEKPQELKTKYDVEKNESSYMYFPNKIHTSEVVYFAAYYYRSDRGKDIFRVTRQNDGTWSKPENLGNVINSQYDEDYPILAADGSTLYFASKGHYSVGGYDIYKSVFDWQTQTWSTPENLGFPINSPFDEILYVPSWTGETAYFASTRDQLEDSLTIYKLQVEDNPGLLKIDSYEALVEIAQLNIYKEEYATTVQLEEQPNEESPEQINQSTIGFPEEAEYNALLDNALRNQMRADSVSRLLDTKRYDLAQSKSDSERTKIEDEIKFLEDQAFQFQKEADADYVNAREIEQRNLDAILAAQSNINEPIEKEASLSCELVFGMKSCDKLQDLYEKELAKEELEKRLNAIKADKKELEILKAESKDDRDKKKIDDQIYKVEKEYYRVLFKLFDVQEEVNWGKWDIYTKNQLSLNEEFEDLALRLNKTINQQNATFEKAGDLRKQAYSAKTKERTAQYLSEAIDLQFESLNEIEFFLTRKLGLTLEFEIDQRKIAEFTQQTMNDADTSVFIKPVSLNQFVNDSSVLEAGELDLVHEYLAIGFENRSAPAYEDDNPIPIDLELPKEVFYRIQLGAFSKKVAYTTFKGMFPITGELNDSRTVTKYYAGMFYTYDEAQKALPTVRNSGFKDAFVVPYYNGARTSLDKAKNLENKPRLSSFSTTKMKKEENTENKVVFKLQIGAYSGDIPKDKYELVNSVKGNLVLDNYINAKGLNIYSLGDFETYENASTKKQELKQKGLADTFVTAYYGNNRIPVDQALKLIK